jgi:nitroimidazol reductase NimA-like FMN-containing flavoprotein (pyridoxamine 5'-phosphate oxidase superfamily)
MAITKVTLLDFLRSHHFAVQSSVNEDGFPQSAAVGIAVTDDLEIIFDTLRATRKANNLRRNPHIAFVVGSLVSNAQCCVQYEGIARELQAHERERLLAFYINIFPDALKRLSWKDITHFVVRPTWIRYLDYKTEPPNIVELGQAALSALALGQTMAY